AEGDEVPDLRSACSAVGLARGSARDEVDVETGGKVDDLVARRWLAKVEPERNSGKVVAMGLQRPAVDVDGKCDSVARQLEPEAQPARAREQVYGDRPILGLDPSSPAFAVRAVVVRRESQRRASPDRHGVLAHRCRPWASR